MEFINKEEVVSRILDSISSDSTAELLEKSMSHKYFKREGAPGSYKYYYTEADWKAGRSSASEPKESSKNLPVIDELKRVGLEYKLNPENKVNPIESILIPVNQSDTEYKKIYDVIDRYNLRSKVKYISEKPKEEVSAEKSDLKKDRPIGKTKSGKDIYEGSPSSNLEHYANFTAEDHRDAEKLYIKMHHESTNKDDKDAYASIGQAHDKLFDKKKKEGLSDSTSDGKKEEVSAEKSDLKKDRAYTNEVLRFLSENYVTQNNNPFKPTFVDRQTDSYRIKLSQKVCDVIAKKFPGVKVVMAGSPKTSAIKVPFEKPQ